MTQHSTAHQPGVRIVCPECRKAYAGFNLPDRKGLVVRAHTRFVENGKPRVPCLGSGLISNEIEVGRR